MKQVFNLAVFIAALIAELLRVSASRKQAGKKNNSAANFSGGIAEALQLQPPFCAQS